jgi:hypothetical protein
MQTTFTRLAGLMLAAGLIACAGQASAAAFTAGDLVIYRVGDGSAGLSSAATSVFLDEYTTSGTFVQSVAMPTIASGSNHMLTASGTAISEGELTLSADGKNLVLTGYDAATGTASIAGTTSSSFNRVVGVVNVATGAINTTTHLTDASYTSNNIRSATMDASGNIWTAGTASGSNGGVRATTLGGTTSTLVSTTVTNVRQVEIFNNQLYVSDSSGSASRLGTVGTGLPTTSGQTITSLPGLPTSTGSAYAFFMADLNNSVAGMDTLYVADDTSGTAGGILKYSLVGGSWVANGQVGTGTDAYRGLTGEVVNGQVNLFATGLGGTGATGGGKLVSITDASGYNGSITGTTAFTLSTALTNEAFRGVAVIPVPEADSYALMALGMGLVGFLARRRKV